MSVRHCHDWRWMWAGPSQTGNSKLYNKESWVWGREQVKVRKQHPVTASAFAFSLSSPPLLPSEVDYVTWSVSWRQMKNSLLFYIFLVVVFITATKTRLEHQGSERSLRETLKTLIRWIEKTLEAEKMSHDHGLNKWRWNGYFTKLIYKSDAIPILKNSQ